MLKTIESEKGFALLLVLLMTLILSATVITVSSALKGQTNVASVADGSTIALAHAENGLAIAVPLLAQSGAAAFGNGFTLRTNDGYTITINYSSTNNVVTSTATSRNGRYRRTIQLGLTPTTTTGTGNIPNYAVLAGGDITEDSGASNINANSEQFFANGDIRFNNLTLDPGNREKAAFYAHGEVLIKNTGNYKPERIAGGQPEVPFPQLDFNKLVGNQTPIDVNNQTKASDLSNTIKNAIGNKTGDIVIVLRVDKQVTIDQNFDVNSNQNVSLVFIPKDSNSSYKVSMSTTNSNINGSLNLLANGGYFDLDKYSVNSPGVLYTNYPRDGIDKDNIDALTVDSQKKNFSFGAIMVNGNIKVSNTNWNFNFAGRSTASDFLQTYVIQNPGVSVVGGTWREL